MKYRPVHNLDSRGAVQTGPHATIFDRKLQGKQSILLLIFSATKLFWVGVVSAALAGTFLAITANSSQILIQNTVDGSMRGRVMSLYSLTYRAGPAMGALLMGGISTWTGLQVPVAGGAIICLMALAIIAPHRKRLASELERTSSLSKT